MKISRIFFLLIVAFIISSCSDDDDFENTVQPASDLIEVGVDTFHIQTNGLEIEKIPSKVAVDTFLLGRYVESSLGTTEGSILAQFDMPGEVSLPKDNGTLIVDSTTMSVVIHFSEFKAAGDSSIHIQLHRMSDLLEYRGKYYSNINSSEYINSTILKDTTVRVTSTSTSITIPLPDDLVEEFTSEFSNSSSTFTSLSSFLKFFPGLYFTFGDGTSTILSVIQIDMYYGYKFKNTAGTEIIQSISFPANKNVRQVNQIKQTYNSGIEKEGELLIASPAGKAVELSLPIEDMRKRMGITSKDGMAYVEGGTKKMSVNSAILSLQVADTFTVDKPTYILLVKKNLMESFFADSDLPDNISAILGVYNSTLNAYSFTMKYYLADVMKKETITVSDSDFVAIPVMVTLDSSGNILSVMHDTNMHAVLVKGGANINPLQISVVVSGF